MSMMGIPTQQFYNTGANQMYSQLGQQAFGQMGAARARLAAGIRQSGEQRAQRALEVAKLLGQLRLGIGQAWGENLGGGLSSMGKSIGGGIQRKGESEFKAMMEGERMKFEKQKEANDLELRRRLADLAGTTQTETARHQGAMEEAAGLRGTSTVAEKEALQRAETLTGVFQLAVRDEKLKPEQIPGAAMLGDAQLAELEQFVTDPLSKALMRSYRMVFKPYLPQAPTTQPAASNINPQSPLGLAMGVGGQIAGGIRSGLGAIGNQLTQVPMFPPSTGRPDLQPWELQGGPGLWGDINQFSPSRVTPRDARLYTFPMSP